MNGKIPRISPTKLIHAIEKMGFLPVRQSGSHRIFRNSEGVRITVPFHAKKTIHPKIIKTILRDLDMTLDEFKKFL